MKAAKGWFQGLGRDGDAFPTCVGMNQLIRRPRRIRSRVPHVRGDEPHEFGAVERGGWRSPRAWG